MFRKPKLLILVAIFFFSLNSVISPLCYAFSFGSSFSPEDERVLGRKFLRMVQAQLPLVTDPDVGGYVERVAKTILAQAGPQLFNYRYYVIRDDALNAFAAPSGLLFVHTGMVEAVNSESELAGVIAHEIGHVVQRHIARRAERMQKLSLITLAGVLAGIFLGGGGKSTEAITTGALATTGSLSLKYSRDDEEEADRIAFKWVQSAGYDARGMADVFRKIRRYRFLGSSTVPSYLTTHPDLEERIGYLEDLVLSHPASVTRNNNSGLRQCQIRISLALKSPTELRDKWLADLRNNPEDPYLFYAVALTFQAEKQFAKSDDYLSKAAKSGLPSALVKGEKGINALGLGKQQTALDYLKEANKEDPGTARYQLYLARAFKDTGNIEEAVKTLEKMKDLYPDYNEIYYNLSEIYGTQKKTAVAQYNLGMYYLLTGDHLSGVKHLRQALNHPDLSPGKRKEIQEILSDFKDMDKEGEKGDAGGRNKKRN